MLTAFKQTELDSKVTHVKNFAHVPLEESFH